MARSIRKLSELVGEWRAVAAELGLAQAEVEALTGKIAERPLPAGVELARLGEQLAGSRGLTEKASTFDRRAVIQAMAEGHTYGATVARVEGLVDRFLGSRHVLAVESEPALAGPDTLRRRDGSLVVRPTGEKYTTPELLAREAALVAGAQRRTGDGAGTADADTVGRAPAGTGKTYALDAAREASPSRAPSRSSAMPRRSSSRARALGRGPGVLAGLLSLGARRLRARP